MRSGEREEGDQGRGRREVVRLGEREEGGGRLGEIRGD